MLCSQHLSISIDEIVQSCLTVFGNATNLMPKFKVHGGTDPENLALQNVQVWEPVHLTQFESFYSLFSHHSFLGNVGSFENGVVLSVCSINALDESQEWIVIGTWISKCRREVHRNYMYYRL